MYGIDYNEIFVPVAKMNTKQMLVCSITHFGWPLLQYDVQNVFLQRK